MSYETSFIKCRGEELISTDNKILRLFENFKVIVYVPFSDFNKFLAQLEIFDLNQIGEYKNCLSWSEVLSTWTPLDTAHPYIGEANKRSLEKEVRLEFSCKKGDLMGIIDFIKSIHPYEKPEIDIVPIVIV